MRCQHCPCLLLTIMVALAALSNAQVTTGVPPFRSFGGGPDVVNLGNLNVHYTIPVFSRAGRGIPFSYALAYDSSVWIPAGSVWIRSGGDLSREVAAQFGFARFTVRQAHCIDPYDGSLVNYNRYFFSGYQDSAGTWHPISLTVVDDDTCTGTPMTATGIAADGSGITMTVDGFPSASVRLRTGEVIIPALGAGTSNNQTDSNGNQITATTSGNITSFYDTLSATTPVMTIDKTNPASVLYQYTAPSGVARSVTVSYTNYTIRTNFGCAGISEYGPVANSPLVDRITLPDSSYYQFIYEVTPGDTNNPHHVTGRLAALRLPTGGTISYTYTGGNNGIMCADGSTAGFDRVTPDGTWHYSRSGTAPAYTTTITDPQGNQTLIDFQGEFETQRRIYQGAATGTPLAAVITCYNGNLSNCPTTPLTTPFTQITKFRQLNGWAQQARTDTFLDGYGQTTRVDEYDFGATTPTRQTVIQYAALGNNIVDRVSSIVVQDSAGNLKSKTTFAYDQSSVTATTGTPNHISVAGARGNVTTVTTYSTPTSSLSRTFTYFDTGTIRTATDVNGAITSNTYGAGSCGNSFVTNVSLPLNLNRSMQWNCTGGVMTQVTDENGKTTQVAYGDANFWRPTSTTDQLGITTDLQYSGLTKTESSLVFNAGNSTVDKLVTLDGLGRVIFSQEKQSASPTANYDSVQITYDSVGRPQKTTMPYSAAASTACTGTCPGTTISYDALGRPTQTVDGGGGTVNTTYIKNDVYTELTATGEASKFKQLEYDAYGRLTSVCEVTTLPGSGSCGQTTNRTGYWTKYIYDVAPNLNSLTVNQNAQPGGTVQTRTYISDMLGRLTSETNPEDGQVQYFYDSAPATPGAACPAGTYNGDLVKRVDAAGNTTCYTYDALHRLLSVTYPGGPNSASTHNKYYVYDAATVNGVAMANPKGRLAEAYTCTTACPGTKITDVGMSYTARGELADFYESTPHSSGSYHLTMAYWEHGGLKQLMGVGLPTLTYGVDAKGRPYNVSGSVGGNPVTATTYNNANQPLQVTFGSGDPVNYNYDANTGRMTQYKLTINGSATFGNLTWNKEGTLKSLAITDPFNAADAQTCNYSYDDLSRLSSVDCGASKWQQNFSYDPFGNITKTVPTGGTGISFTPGYSSTTNRFTSIPGGTPAYDANGNLTNDLSHTYTWDAEGRPVTIGAIGLTYDALGQMVEEQNGATFTEYVYALGQKLALMNGQTQTKAFVPLPGGTQVKYTGTTISTYRLPDWLGSLRVGSNPNRTYSWGVAFAPYGERYATSVSPAWTFTGQTADVVSDEYDFMFREYHSTQGRWISPDPAGMAAVTLGNPQSWNRYAYVGNSPLVLTDSLGLFGKYSDCIGCNPYMHSAGDKGFSFMIVASWSEVPDSVFTPVTLTAENELVVTEVQGTHMAATYSLALGPSSGGSGPGGTVDTVKAANNGLLSKLKNLVPSVCSGGGFAYGGGEVEAGPVKAELIGVVAYDSKEGGQHGGIVAGGLGPFTGGIESTRTWSDWQEHTTNIGFVNGASAITPRKLGPMEITKSNYGGLFQFNNGQLTVGGYVGLETKGARAFGTGGYLTLSWSGCHN